MSAIFPPALFRNIWLFCHFLILAAFANASSLLHGTNHPIHPENNDWETPDLSTFLGGSGEDRAHGMAVDTEGNTYLIGPIGSKDFPITENALFESPSGIYLAKLNPLGTILFSTYIGVPGGINYAHDVTLDEQGNIYLVGNTTNSNFPTTEGAFQMKMRGPEEGHHGDAFIMKIAPNGERIIYSTFLGGSGRDICGKIALDKKGYAYVLGCTSSTDFPVTENAFQRNFKGGEEKPTGRGDLFVAKLSPDGSRLEYCTYLGGSEEETYSQRILVDCLGQAHLIATSLSNDFPTTPNAYSKTFSGRSDSRGMGDAVIVKLASDGSDLIYSSYLGGSGDERGTDIALDAEGNIWVCGDTNSTDFPTTSDTLSSTLTGGFDGYLAGLDPQDGSLLFSSLIGGSGNDSMSGIVEDSRGRMILYGSTESGDFLAPSKAEDPSILSPADLFIATINPESGLLETSVCFGGSNHQIPGPVVITNEHLTIAGNTTSEDFPLTKNAADKTYNGGSNRWGGDIFLVRYKLPKCTDGHCFESAYLGQTPRGDSPVIFAPGIVSVEGKNTQHRAVK